MRQYAALTASEVAKRHEENNAQAQEKIEALSSEIAKIESRMAEIPGEIQGGFKRVMDRLDQGLIPRMARGSETMLEMTETFDGEFKTLDAKGFFTTSTTYKKIGTQLWISPRRIGSKTLALDVKLVGSQNVGSQAVLQAQGSATPIEIPIIAYRTAKTVVHLKPGPTLVSGGMTQEKEQESTGKGPVLGGTPIPGWLFRSTLRVKERQHVIFAISPRIIQRSDFDSEL